MAEIVLTEALLANLAGWEAMKTARGLVAAGRVLTSEWQPPGLRGTVRQGDSVLRAGLVIRNASDADNLCPCRDSKARGLICAHSVAVGLHFLKPPPPVVALKPAASTLSEKIPQTGKCLRRAVAGETGEPLEIHWILPPNLIDATSRGRLMLYLEGARQKGRAPLASLPMDGLICVMCDRDEAICIASTTLAFSPSMN